jgi:hypothetical protein
LGVESAYLKKLTVLCQEVAVKYAWMKKYKRLFPVAVMCRVLKVSTSGYYEEIYERRNKRHN